MADEPVTRNEAVARMKRIVLALLALACGVAQGQEDGALFETKVRPLLDAHCRKCHGDGKLRGGFDVRSSEAILRGSTTGKVVTPGSPDKSLLLRLLTADGEPHMPPQKQLTSAQIA